MFLYVRMILYFVFSAFSGTGIAIYDSAAGTITFQIDDLARLITGIVGFVATFVASRIASARGGKT
jgi:uncharacterized membrane protein